MRTGIFRTVVTSLASSILLISAPAVQADDEPRASMATTGLKDAETTVSNSTIVYKKLIRGGKVPPSVLKDAKCIAVFSNVVTAALAVGGTHGDGVAFCRNTTNQDWENPVFLNLTGGSIGIQAGVKSTDLVLYMTGKNAKSSLQNGSFRLAGELTAVAGSFDKTFVAPPEGVVAYATTDGVFAGASIAGVGIDHDKDEQKAFYGNYDPASIFASRVPASLEKSVRELRDLLPA